MTAAGWVCSACGKQECGCTEDALPGCHVTRGMPCDCQHIVDTMLADAEKEANRG